MRDGLTCRCPDVDPDVEAVWLMTAQDCLPSDLYTLNQAGLLSSRGLEPRRHVSACRDQSVPLSDRECIPQADDRRIVLMEHPLGRGSAEGARHVGSRSISSVPSNPWETHVAQRHRRIGRCARLVA